MINKKREPFLRKHFILLTTMLIAISIVFDINRAVLLDVFFGVCFLLMPYSGIVECICFLFPLATTYEFAHIYLMVLALGIAKRKSINLASIVCILSVMLLEINTYFLYDKTSFNRMMGYLVTISMVILLIYERKMQIDKAACLKMYILGTAALFAMYLLSAFMKYGTGFLTPILMGGQRFGGTEDAQFSGMSISVNANYLAYFSVCAMGCIITLMQTKRMRVSEKRIMLLLFVFIAFIGAVTLSRTWAITVLMLIFCYSLANNGNVAKTVARFIFAVVLCAAVGIFLSKTTNIIDSLRLRFTNEDISTAGQRFTTFDIYLSAFFKSDSFMLWGAGVTDYTKLFTSRYSIHNALIQILVCCGIPGTIILLSILYAPIFSALRKKVKLVYWIPFIMQFAFVQTIQFLDPCTLMLPHVISVFALHMKDESEKNSREL